MLNVITPEPFNRTKVECKCLSASSGGGQGLPFNRTKVECKLTFNADLSPAR